MVVSKIKEEDQVILHLKIKNDVYYTEIEDIANLFHVFLELQNYVEKTFEEIIVLVLAIFEHD